MLTIARDVAERTLANVPLSPNARRFADWWLAQLTTDGELANLRSNAPMPGDLAASTMTCEVRPWQTVLCRSVGDNITRALGIDLAGRDMLALLVPAQRATRLARYVKVAQGGLQVSHRQVVAADQSKLRVRELMLPHSDSTLPPLEGDARLTITFLEADALPPGTRVLVSRGALSLAGEVEFFDFRDRSVGPAK